MSLCNKKYYILLELFIAHVYDIIVTSKDCVFRSLKHEMTHAYDLCCALVITEHNNHLNYRTVWESYGLKTYLDPTSCYCFMFPW